MYLLDWEYLLLSVGPTAALCQTSLTKDLKIRVVVFVHKKVINVIQNVD